MHDGSGRHPLLNHELQYCNLDTGLLGAFLRRNLSTTTIKGYEKE